MQTLHVLPRGVSEAKRAQKHVSGTREIAHQNAVCGDFSLAFTLPVEPDDLCGAERKRVLQRMADLLRMGCGPEELMDNLRYLNGRYCNPPLAEAELAVMAKTRLVRAN